MTIDGDFKLLKIQTCVLRVNIHCDGCKMKVKKLLQRIDGVYQLNIDTEQQKVTVSGSVDSATLIKKLIRSGKHAELWSQKTNQNPETNSKICFKDEKNDKNQLAKQGILKGVEAFKNLQKLPIFIPGEDDFFDEVDDEGEDEVDELQFLREKANGLGFLGQQAIEAANNGKKNIANPVNNVKTNQIGNRNGDSKGNPTLGNAGNSGIGPDLIETLRLNNAQNRGSKVGTFLNVGGNSANSVNFGGHNGNNAANDFGNSAGGIGYGGFQNQIPSGVLSAGHNPYGMMTSTNGGSYTSPLMMDVQSRGSMFQQPQTMYQRSTFVPPSTGYYCNNYDNYGPNPCYNCSCYTTNESDENSGSCSIM